MRWLTLLLFASAGCSAKNAGQNSNGGPGDLSQPSAPMDAGSGRPTDSPGNDLGKSGNLGGTSSGGGGGGSADLANLVAGGGPLVTARPYHFHVPPGYAMANPTPLVILLHGYTANGDEQELYWNLTAVSDKETFLYAYPDGTLDATGARFWNATDACCDFDNLAVDDVAYVNAIIDDVQAKYNVDGKRIFVTGHSNGGFMSHRFACDAPRVAAIASLAGAQWQDLSKCQPAGPVSVLEIHGDTDLVIAYNGGNILGKQFPSVKTTVGDWATRNGCTSALTDTGMTLDLDALLPGAETTVANYSGCKAGGAVELWTIKGGSHVPTLQSTWGELIYGFLAAHPKP